MIWEAELVLLWMGILFVTVGSIAAHWHGKKLGLASELGGIVWLITFGIYYWFKGAGFYDPVGGILIEKAGYIPNLLGVLAILIGLYLGYVTLTKVRKK